MNEQDLQPTSGDTHTDTPVPEETNTPEVTPEPAEVAASSESEATVADTAKPEGDDAAPAVETGTSETESTEEKVSTETTTGGVKAFIVAKRYTIMAVGLVIVGLFSLLFVMERQNKIDTGLFDGFDSFLSKFATAATVNGQKINEHDLAISIAQIATGATAQGIDIEDPQVKSEIRTQALDMLVNTELLKQEAGARGLVVTDQEVTDRRAKLVEEIGGEAVLAERMTQFNIDDKTLARDIKNELTIQKLLDEVFAEKNVSVSEEEIADFYEQAGGAEAGLPELDSVRSQIETQIKTTKEQEVVTAFIEELRAKATITIAG
jgi:hypothetical protein